VSEDDKPPRPTKLCLEDLGLQVPTIDVCLGLLDHILIKEAQRLPALHAADGVERVQCITDLIWFKVKAERWRGAAIRLSREMIESDVPSEAGAWWLGRAGYRREGSPEDFYTSIEKAYERAGGSNQWLPSDWDWTRFRLEAAYAWERGIRDVVCRLIANSLRDGCQYYVELEGYRITATARARDNETYLAIGTENSADPKVFAVIINAVPGIDKDDWMPEPGGAAGLVPGAGEVIWSTILPPDVAAALLERFP